MTAITIHIPNHEIGFFKKMISKMGWTYSEADVVRTAPTAKEKTLAKIDHAFGQLRQCRKGHSKALPRRTCSMNCRITATPDFAHELKKLAKRYPSMKNDYASFLDELRQNPMMAQN